MRIADLLIIANLCTLAITMVSYHIDTDFCGQLIHKLKLGCKPDQTLQVELQLKFFYKKFQN